MVLDDLGGVRFNMSLSFSTEEIPTRTAFSTPPDRGQFYLKTRIVAQRFKKRTHYEDDAILFLNHNGLPYLFTVYMPICISLLQMSF